MENMDKGLTLPKMGADSSAENTPNAPICLLKPKSSVCQWRKDLLDVRSPWYLHTYSI